MIEDAYGYAPSHLRLLHTWSENSTEYAAFLDKGNDQVSVLFGPEGGLNWGMTMDGRNYTVAELRDPVRMAASGLPSAVLTALESAAAEPAASPSTTPAQPEPSVTPVTTLPPSVQSAPPTGHKPARPLSSLSGRTRSLAEIRADQEKARELREAQESADRWERALTGGEGSLRWPIIAVIAHALLTFSSIRLMLTGEEFVVAFGGMLLMLTAIYTMWVADTLTRAVSESDVLRIALSLSLFVSGLMAFPGSLIGTFLFGGAGPGPWRVSNLTSGVMVMVFLIGFAIVAVWAATTLLFSSSHELKSRWPDGRRRRRPGARRQ